MISFINSSDGENEKIAEKLSREDDKIKEEVLEIIESFSEFSQECDFAFCRFEDFLSVRIFDREMYAFVYPIPLCDGASEENFLLEIGKYALKEEIPLIFCDIPAECVSTFEECFRFTELTDDGCGSYTGRVLSELSRAVDIPEISDGVLTLSPLKEEDIPLLAKLSRDSELNKYWGYDYREDIEDASDAYFYNTACSAAEDGTALTLAVRLGDIFIGEGTIWGFDLHGGASVAFRIFPEFHKRGFGKRTFQLLLKLGSEIGLLQLCASVMCENLPSKKILDRYMVLCRSENGVNNYLHRY